MKDCEGIKKMSQSLREISINKQDRANYRILEKMRMDEQNDELYMKRMEAELNATTAKLAAATSQLGKAEEELAQYKDRFGEISFD